MKLPELNVPVIRLLVIKDWQLFQKQLALFVLGAIVALCLLGMARSWSFYAGSLLLIIVMVSIACFSVSTSLLEERKQKTLAFVMSLPVSPLDFYAAKLAGNLITFLTPFVLLVAGTLAVILFTELPNGLVVYSLLLFGHVWLAYCVSLSTAMAVESEGWNTFAMIASMVLINPFIMGMAQIPAINDAVSVDAITWSGPAISILTAQLLLGIAALVASAWVHCRKPAFY